MLRTSFGRESVGLALGSFSKDPNHAMTAATSILKQLNDVLVDRSGHLLVYDVLQK